MDTGTTTSPAFAGAASITRRHAATAAPIRRSGFTRTLSLIIVAAAATTFAVGLAREIYILALGEGTFLQEGRHFNLDGEANLPAWFASMAWLVAAALTMAFAFTDHTKRARRLWGAMAVMFFLISVDEVASFHEAIMDPLREALGVSGVLHYAWVIPAIAVVLVLGVVYFRFIASLNRSVSRRIVLAAIVFVTGAAGMEMIAGVVISSGGQEADIAYRLEILAEEGLEILGVALLLQALLLQWDRMGLAFGRTNRAGEPS